MAVVDLRGGRGTCAAPQGAQILSISCSFWENLAKSYVGAPRGVGAPSSGKSWIRHCMALSAVKDLHSKILDARPTPLVQFS